MFTNARNVIVTNVSSITMNQGFKQKLAEPFTLLLKSFRSLIFNSSYLVRNLPENNPRCLLPVGSIIRPKLQYPTRCCFHPWNLNFECFIFCGTFLGKFQPLVTSKTTFALHSISVWVDFCHVLGNNIKKVIKFHFSQIKTCYQLARFALEYSVTNLFEGFVIIKKENWC